eukprot:CAMPEP_0197858968 /NCGR_PEP_ID=MMETSP1438-20131217/33184_1 /TAXON_ID=1461541 /ORGANISM="Pterosperma sp., Strain CCMP1384" /LENGTH=275 /DNA_ID=CAMNT_0043475305 /DNA_START=360 /DNA_END=1184 /DNA_ORIENTATION=-
MEPPDKNADEQRKRAEERKECGNRMYQKQKFSAAIEAYTEAITFCPTWTVPLVNRALCHKKKRDWAAVIMDSEQALRMDPDLFKAHFFWGVALLETDRCEEAIRRLEKALQLAHDREAAAEDIWRQLARAKYKQWCVDSTERQERRDKMRANALNDLALRANHLRQTGVDEATINAQIKEQEGLLEEVLKEASARDIKGEIPSAFTCNLTMEPFRDPMTTPAGLSYERSYLQEHFNKVGHFDPVTRQPLNPKQCLLNKGLRQATQEYLNEHAWAW